MLIKGEKMVLWVKASFYITFRILVYFKRSVLAKLGLADGPPASVFGVNVFVNGQAGRLYAL